jgi:hypothetical protein
VEGHPDLAGLYQPGDLRRVGLVPLCVRIQPASPANGRRSGDAIADVASYVHAHLDAYAVGDVYAVGDAHAVADACANRDTSAYVDVNCALDAGGDANAHGHSDRHAYADSYGHAISDAKPYANFHTDCGTISDANRGREQPSQGCTWPKGARPFYDCRGAVLATRSRGRTIPRPVGRGQGGGRSFAAGARFRAGVRGRPSAAGDVSLLDRRRRTGRNVRCGWHRRTGAFLPATPVAHGDRGANALVHGHPSGHGHPDGRERNGGQPDRPTN